MLIRKCTNNLLKIECFMLILNQAKEKNVMSLFSTTDQLMHFNSTSASIHSLDREKKKDYKLSLAVSSWEEFQNELEFE